MRTPGASTCTPSLKTARKCTNDEVLPVVIGYVTAILVGLPLPKVAVALYFGIAVYLVVPFGEVRRLLFRR